MVGSGPAGLACAQQLARAGHSVTLFEKNDRIGGLLRYGIPDFKMEKHLIDRRMRQMEAEGVAFRTGVEVGVGDFGRHAAGRLRRGGAVGRRGSAARPASRGPRALRHPFRDGFPHPAEQARGRRSAKPRPRRSGTISAKGKHVIVIGGGDTGSDCIGTSNRQGAASVTQLEIMPQPPEQENKALTWPDWPLKLRTSSSQEEGCERDWSVLTKRAHRRERQDHGARMRAGGMDSWATAASMQMVEVAGQRIRRSRPIWCCWRWALSARARQGWSSSRAWSSMRAAMSRPTLNDYKTSAAKIFSCGDMRRGQSLVVWAIREGRQCARGVDEFLMGSSELPR